MASHLRAGSDFYVAYSPERVDPGSARWTTRNIPKAAVTDHRGVDYGEIARRAPLVVDAGNALAGIEGAHIFRL